jgi:hypothetical protein
MRTPDADKKTRHSHRRFNSARAPRSPDQDVDPRVERALVQTQPEGAPSEAVSGWELSLPPGGYTYRIGPLALHSDSQAGCICRLRLRSAEIPEGGRRVHVQGSRPRISCRPPTPRSQRPPVRPLLKPSTMATLTPETIATVQATIPALEERGVDIITDFYSKVCLSAP